MGAGVELLAVIITVAAVFIATVFDLRKSRIPNEIFYVMLLSSIPINIFLGREIIWLTNILLSSIIAYLLWRLMIWGGGDAKILVGISALIPVNPSPTILPPPPYNNLFFLSIIMNLLIIHLIYALLLILSRDKAGSPPSTLVSILLSVAVLTVLLCTPFAATLYPLMLKYSLVLFILLALLIYLKASRISLVEEVKVSELEGGEHLAEEVELGEGRVLKPTPQGISCEDIGELMRKAAEDRIRVHKGMKLAPLMLISLLLSLLLGDLIGVMVGYLHTL